MRRICSREFDGEEPDPQGTNAEVLLPAMSFGDDAGLQQSDGFMAMKG